MPLANDRSAGWWIDSFHKPLILPASNHISLHPVNLLISGLYAAAAAAAAGLLIIILMHTHSNTHQRTRKPWNTQSPTFIMINNLYFLLEPHIDHNHNY